MKSANDITPPAPARARNAARKSAEAPPGDVIDEPIYKRKRMPTVVGMFKRILFLTTGLVLGVALSVAGRRAAAAWSLWPNRDLSKSSAYVKDVMKLVNENYVDEKAAAYDKLAREALHGMIESLDPHSEFLEAKDHP